MRYRRAWVAGGSFFFTVVTAKRRPLFASVEAVDVLRIAFRTARARHPLNLDAIVVLPDHLHCMWSLPAGDADFAICWRLIKTWFTKHCDPVLRIANNGGITAKREEAIWQHRYWEHVSGTRPIVPGIWITFILIPSSMVWFRRQLSGRIPVFISTSDQGYMHPIGGRAARILKGLGMNSGADWAWHCRVTLR
ncbi:REP element-mobilizing transposase RayT [Nitrosovibrio sp. Nv6]|nr:REP element-mobilizing transposase RayT [Nitrosovibrio sp. Nv6]